MTDRDFRIRLTLLWLLVSLLMVVLVRGNIATNVLPDGDDYMRLQQVRDLLGGQSWFDLHQYRYVPPVGEPMHWSRLVDIPIAALVLIFRPFAGQIIAERIAEVIVPLLTLGCVMALVAAITRRLAGERPAFFAAALIPTSPLLWMQLQPLRIDHHGWQVVMALLMAHGLLDHRNERRGGIVAGIAAATWLAISLEGLPFAAGLGGLFAWRWFREDRPQGLESYGWALAGTSFVYFAAMQPPSGWSEVRCDSVSPPYLWGLAVIAVGIALACRLKLAKGWRLPVLALVAIGGAAALAVTGPACRSGPFAQLDPIVRNLWFQNVPEGLPVWTQSLPVKAMILGFPLIALFGSWRARQQAEGERRRDWTVLILMQIASIAIAIMVQRTGAVETALAMPGGAWLIATLTARAGQLERPVTRIFSTAAVILLLAPLTLPLLANISFTHETRAADAAAGDTGCALPANVAKLDALPASNIAATFDLSATIISMTHHHVLATAHHRNFQGMKDLVIALTRSPEMAQAILKRRKIDFLVLCPDLNEVRVFTKLGPNGIVDRLSHGGKIAWLQPVRLPAYPQIRIWRVL
jgi:hypothetical protein